jgi:hypothetical protein
MDSILLSFDVKTKGQNSCRMSAHSCKKKMQIKIIPPLEAMANLLFNIETQIHPSKPELQKDIL